VKYHRKQRSNLFTANLCNLGMSSSNLALVRWNSALMATVEGKVMVQKSFHYAPCINTSQPLDFLHTLIIWSHTRLWSLACSLRPDFHLCSPLRRDLSGEVARISPTTFLSLKPHEKSYTLGWVNMGSQVRVTLSYRVLIFIGKHYREETLCDVLNTIWTSINFMLSFPLLFNFYKYTLIYGVDGLG